MYNTKWEIRLEKEPLIYGDYLVLKAYSSFKIINWRLNKRTFAVVSGLVFG